MKTNHVKRFLNFFKLVVAFVLLLMMIFRTKVGVKKLYKGETTTVSSMTVEDPFTFPTLTICITMDVNFTGGFENKEWLDPEKYSFPFPFEDFGRVGTKSAKTDLNNVTMLEELNIDYKDYWDTSVQGMFGEPVKCYSFQHLGYKTSGIQHGASFRMKVRSDPSIAIYFSVHNPSALVPSTSRLLGSEFAMIFIKENVNYMNMYYEANRANVTKLQNCTDKMDGDDKVLMENANGNLQTAEQCILDFYHNNLNCNLPWAPSKSMNPNLTTCTESSQYLKYKDLIRILDKAPSSTFWDLVKCKPPCKYTKYEMKLMADSNFDSLMYKYGKTDGSNLEINMFFTSPAIEMSEEIWVYDGNAFFADIGGYLGLFLGVSIYSIVEVVVEAVQERIKQF